MNKHLIIDGKDLGPCVGYRQNPNRKQWVFLMVAGYFIHVDFMNTKSFDSGTNTLNIVTFQEA